jgi:hypothetical protein
MDFDTDPVAWLAVRSVVVERHSQWVLERVRDTTVFIIAFFSSVRLLQLKNNVIPTQVLNLAFKLCSLIPYWYTTIASCNCLCLFISLTYCISGKFRNRINSSYYGCSSH